MCSQTEAKNESEGTSSGGQPAEATKEKGNHWLFHAVIHYGLKDLCHTAKLEQKIKCKRSSQNRWDY